MRAPALAVALFAACGGGPEPRPAPAAAPISPIAPPAGPADEVVARVDGRPVWSSCVAGQLARGAADRRAALDECVAFELLAAAADARGLAGDPEVAAETRRALVSRVVQLGFEDRYRTPADLRQPIDRIIERNRDKLVRPELRGSTFLRIELPGNAPPERVAQARALADQAARELAGRTGLFGIDLQELERRLAGTTDLRMLAAEVPPSPREALDAAYGDALWSVPEVGQVAGPVRTSWGWDLVLLSEQQPPRTYTHDEVAAELFPGVRRTAFQTWIHQLAKSLGAKIEVDAAQLEEPTS
ncbi:MAG: peptidylprolyl isomerase [Kofleriaceae bacterium]